MTSVQEEITFVLGELGKVKSGPDSLRSLLEILRTDMEVPAPVRGSGGGNGSRQFGIASQSSALNWRTVSGSNPSSSQKVFGTSAFTSGSFSGAGSGNSSTGGAGKYVSRFTNSGTKSGSIDSKILNTVIGNKLNTFTPKTYNDTRDFIYQILDSGETEFIKEFVEKVFMKATVEDLYCAYFAQLIAEISQKYPVIVEEMRRYHKQFIQIFDDAGDGDIKKREYRMGYGQFISELAGKNALEKEELLGMVKKVTDKIWELSRQAEKTKMVEEFIDCLVRLTGSLKDRSPRFFNTVAKDIRPMIMEFVVPLIEKKAGDRPGLSVKGRCGLMDLRDLVF